MSRTSTLILLGILIALMPFSGLPIAIRTFLAVIFGACVAGIGVALRAREARSQKQSAEASLSPATPSTPSEPTPPPSRVSPI
jgi:hypothetical protein